MTPKAKKLLDIVKRPTSAPPEQKVGGTDPNDQWSAQNKISESPSLNKYLLSRGFDPKHTPKDIKVAHSKSNQFKLWQQHHIGEDLTTHHTGTGVDHKTDLSVSPTKKRLDTLVKAKAHYNIPTPPGTMRKEGWDDMMKAVKDRAGPQPSGDSGVKQGTRYGGGKQKHPDDEVMDQKAGKNFDHLKKPGSKHKVDKDHYIDKDIETPFREAVDDTTPKLNDYQHKQAIKRDLPKHTVTKTPQGSGAQLRGIIESVELDGDQLDEISLGDYKQKAQAQTKELKKHTKGEYSGIVNRMLDRRKKGLAMAGKREHKIETESDVTEGWAVNGSVLSDAKKPKLSASEKMSDYANKRHKVYQGIADKQKELMKMWNDDHKDQPHLQIPIPEDVGDAMAAIKGVGIPISQPNSQPDNEQQKESRASKIKALYKKKMAEDTYDSEKDDKYGQNPTFGKKPVLQTAEKGKQAKNIDGIKTKAAAILTGGTTLTGQKRDTVQIDPDLNNPRPGQSDPNGDRNNK